MCNDEDKHYDEFNQELAELLDADLVEIQRDLGSKNSEEEDGFVLGFNESTFQGLQSDRRQGPTPTRVRPPLTWKERWFGWLLQFFTPAWFKRWYRRRVQSDFPRPIRIRAHHKSFEDDVIRPLSALVVRRVHDGGIEPIPNRCPMCKASMVHHRRRVGMVSYSCGSVYFVNLDKWAYAHAPKQV